MENAGRSVAIVGAGLAGLQCARELRERGIPVRLFDKGRRVGGRVCTRRMDSGAEFDHGAQYFTARGERFQQLVAEWVSRGVVAEWTGRLVQLTAGRTGPEPAATTRYVGVPSMSAIPRDLARGLPEVECGRVTALTRGAEGWSLEWEPGAGGGREPTGGGRHEAGGFGAVVLALPAEQATGLLAGAKGLAWGGVEGGLRERVAGVSISPCWGVLLEFAGRLGVEFDGAFVGDSPLRWVARNNSKPGRPGRECWVLHAGPEWSREHLEASAEWVAGELEQAFWQALGVPGVGAVARQAHRWRYALPESPLAEQFVFAEEAGLGVCGDWCGGPRVEGAWTSGARLGERVAAWWRGH